MHRLASSLCLCLLLLPAPVSHAETYFESAERLLQNGQETEARRALRHEISARPRNLEARYNLAVLLARIGHFDEAAELYRDNIRRGRHLPSIVNLANYQRTHGQKTKAIALLMDSTKKFRSEAVPWYLLAEIAEQDGDNKLAVIYYQKAIRADSGNGFAHLRYARFLAGAGEIKPAARHASESIRLLPGCAPCLRIGGDILMQAGQDGQALKAWQRSMGIEPDADTRRKILANLQKIRHD